jgi:hypothetical protein
MMIPYFELKPFAVDLTPLILQAGNGGNHWSLNIALK